MMINTDKLATVCHIMHLDREIERLRGCWLRARAAGDQKAMSFFERAANDIKRDIAYAKRAGKTL